MDYQDRAVLKFSLCVPDVHWISLKPEVEGLIVPSKIYGIVTIGCGSRCEVLTLIFRLGLVLLMPYLLKLAQKIGSGRPAAKRIVHTG
jgi:hypothetical protein